MKDENKMAKREKSFGLSIIRGDNVIYLSAESLPSNK